MIVGEHKLFELRRAARAGKKAQLNERIAQLQEQIDGLKLQASAKADEIQLIQDELTRFAGERLDGISIHRRLLDRTVAAELRTRAELLLSWRFPAETAT